MNKVRNIAEALSSVKSGMTVAVGGFGGAGFPLALVTQLRELEVGDLVIVSNNAARFEDLIRSGSVSRIVCSFPFGGASPTLRRAIDEAEVELQLLPQGTLSECLRAAGSGLGGVLTRVGIGTEFSEGRQTTSVGGVEYILEPPIRPDVSLIHAEKGDRWGNLEMRGTARNFNYVMAMAADLTIAEANSLAKLGEISADRCDIPGIFVDMVIEISKPNGVVN